MSTIDETMRAAIVEHARRLADQAPPLTSDQLVRLRAIFGTTATGAGGDVG